MRKKLKGLGVALAVAVMGLVESAKADVAATVTSMQTEATTAITAVESGVIAVITAGLVITIAFWAYGKIKNAIRRN